MRNRNPDYFGIYKIVSKLTNEIYIGSSMHVEYREKKHFNLLKLNKHHNIKLQNHVNKYGIDDLEFVLIEKVENENDLIIREQFYIDTLNPKFNIQRVAGSALGLKRTPETIKKMSGRTGWNKGQKTPDHVKEKMSLARKGKPGKPISEETKEKLRQINLGKTSPNKGKKASPESIEKMRQSHLGKKASDETKAKMSEAKKGKKASEETRKKMSIANSIPKPYRRGIPKSEEHKEKIRIANTGFKHTDETKQKMSESRKGTKASDEARKNMSKAQEGRLREKGRFLPKDKKIDKNAAA